MSKGGGRKVQYVRVPEPPKLASLPALGPTGLLTPTTPRASIIRPIPNQPQFEDTDVWGWWLAAFPKSSFPEYLTAWGLVQNGQKMVGCPRASWRGDDFLFQRGDLTGNDGLLLPGVANNTIVDFLVVSTYPYIAIFEDGLFYHQRTKEIDISKRTQLRIYEGYTVVTIDDTALLQNAHYIVAEALAGRDHSHLGPI